MKQPLVWVSVVIIAALLLVVIVNALIIIFNGQKVPTPTIPRETQTFGTGPELRYVVMGDSTTVSQGSDYKEGYVHQSAQYLAKRYQVKLTNLGVSGARSRNVEQKQLPQALKLQPDLVLISIGANDVTHLTSKSAVRSALQNTVDSLKWANPKVKIVITGSAAMGSVDRFPWPTRQLAGWRTRMLNEEVFKPLVVKNKLTFAPIAEQTGPAFAADPTLFARDKFHPSARGYALWTPIINAALDRSLQ